MKSPKRRRNGPVWGLKHFESDILKRFDSDLSEHEVSGFRDEIVCDNVKRTIRSAAEAIPNHNSGTSKLRDLLLREYLPLYTNWNEVCGDGRDKVNRRRELRRGLTQVRKDFRATLNDFTHAIYGALSNTHVDQMIFPFDDLHGRHPKDFPQIKKGVARYKGARQHAWSGNNVRSGTSG